MRTIIIILLLISFGCTPNRSENRNSANEIVANNNSDPQREKIQEIIDRMIEYGVYTGSAVGVSGSKPEQWDNFTALMNEATIDELRSLTDHESPVVRSYSYNGLCIKKDSSVFDIMLKHLYDTEFVETQFGCIGSRSFVGDIFLDEYEWMIWSDENTFKLKKWQLDSILLFTPNIRLKGRTGIFDELELKDSFYTRLKEILIIEKEPEALISMAKYQKPQDRKLIMEYLNQPERFEIEYGLRAVIQFPDPVFYEPLKRVQINEINRDGGFNYPFLRNLYQAFVQYKTKDCRKFLLKTVKETEGSTNEYHSKYIWLALQIYPHPIFDGLEDSLEVSDVSKNLMSY